MGARGREDGRRKVGEGRGRKVEGRERKGGEGRREERERKTEKQSWTLMRLNGPLQQLKV